MLRIVLDTVIFVRCLINPRSIWGSLVFRYADRYQLVLSTPILQEIVEVLNRPELVQKFRRLAGIDRTAVLALLERAERVDLGDIPEVSQDPNDNKFLATAKAANAAFLVTEDNDLLVLNKFEGTAIVSAVEFLRILALSDRGEE